jgi:hypothetical protein
MAETGILVLIYLVIIINYFEEFTVPCRLQNRVNKSPFSPSRSAPSLIPLYSGDNTYDLTSWIND